MHHHITSLIKGKANGTLLRPLALLISISLFTLTAMAQKGVPAVKAVDTSNAKLASRLGISQAKARKISAAFQYKSVEIRAAIADTSQKPSVRQARLRALMQERSQYLRTALGAKLLDSVRILDAGKRQEMVAQRKQPLSGMAARGVTGTNQRPGAARRDTIINRPSYQPRTKL